MVDGVGVISNADSLNASQEIYLLLQESILLPWLRNKALNLNVHSLNAEILTIVSLLDIDSDISITEMKKSIFNFSSFCARPLP